MSLRSITRLLPVLWLLAGLAASARGEQPAEPATRLAELVARGEALLRLDILSNGNAAEAATIAQEILERSRSEPAPSTLSAGDLTSLRADLLLISANPQAALAAYLEAEKLGDLVRPRRGALYQSKLYVPEIYTSELWGIEETSYLLALDPTTGQVRERHLLPGFVRKIQVEAATLRTNYVFRYNQAYVPGSLRIVSGRPDRPIGVTYGSDLLQRLDAMHAGWVLAVNFLLYSDEVSTRSFSPEFRLRDDPLNDAPATFEELEQKLRDAIQHDPTQPWHLFFFGQAQWAQRREVDAVTTWEQLFSLPFPATPYYEFTWMTAIFELYGQYDWADRAYHETLRRRLELHQPLEAATLLERLINLPFVKKRRSMVPIEKQDLERSYIWWQRTRKMSGISELDVFHARAWAAHFEATADPRRAEAEHGYAKLARAYPFQSPLDAAWLDYAMWLMIATSLAFLAVLLSGWNRLPHWRKLAALWPVLRLSRSRTEISPALSGWSAVLLLSTIIVYFSCSLFGFFLTHLGKTASHLFRAIDNPVIETFREVRPSLPTRATTQMTLAEAAARHVTGDLAAARDLYRSLPEEPRAIENLAALEKGQLPPHRISYEDIFGAPLHDSFVRWLRADSWRPAFVLRSIGGVRQFSELGWTSVTYLLLFFLIAILTIFARADDRGFWRRPRRALAKAACLTLPGLLDLQTGRLLRGYAVWGLFLLGIGPALWLVTADRATPGPISDLLYLDVLPYDALLPTPPQLPPEQIDAYYQWTFFWSYPYAHAFWSLVAAALVVSLAAHAARWRDIRDLWRVRLGQ